MHQHIKEIDVNLERYVVLPNGQEIKSTLTVWVEESEKHAIPEIVINLFPGWCWVS